MPVNEPLTVEAAVFIEDVEALANKILKTVGEVLPGETIGGNQHPSCIVAAAMVSAAQVLDGEVAYRPDGATGALFRMLAPRAMKR